ncbi:MAG TPA: tyrosine/phenylalanine carboxypeptidase domain-containing protein [Candidatus Peribacteraceae bacterium]|nr:tyrosine/phenylalanine carboxypeptidase domain-containing protein [Candidatus Peribacteraceae bacterium]
MSVALEDRRSIAQAVIAAEKQMEFSVMLHPANAAEQREKFLSGAIEEPIFAYGACVVPAMNFPEITMGTELEALYRDRIGQTRGLALLLRLVGHDSEFSALGQVLFPVTEVENPPPFSKEKEELSIGAEEIMRTFQEALVACGIEGWEVKLERHCSSRMFVNQWEKKIAVRADVRITPKELSALTRHEIGVHVVRYAHGCMQREPLLHVGTSRGRLVEEGVACFAEHPDGHPRLYERHFAVQMALEHSFRETWQALCEYGCSPEDAWVHTLRVKRGLTDGASHGAFTRDALYAQGFETVRAYISGGGRLDSLLSAPVHPEEIPFFVEEAGMEVFPILPLL